ncbi:MAG: radical SAM protein [Planctomycetes bacterium]|nr:radical SAM protein [Planctomycetota bacterium]
MVPLFAKFRTRAGNFYVYDVSSGEILPVSNVLYHIVGDYHLLTSDEIHEKYRAWGREAIQTALAQLDEAQEEGLLCDHVPEVSAKVKDLVADGKREPIRDFLRHRRRLLTLELTHQCNLACEYCIFGKHYPQTRQRSDAPMSLETAKSAVARFLSRKPKRSSISFYGGEPLLEFERMKEIIAFAEQLASENGSEVSFNLTTNATLLSEEKIHYFVAHEVAVTISVDGDKESHDRYRVFKNTGHPGPPRGSFDVVIGNMQRFVELYPDYKLRGIALTWTATACLPELEQFLRRWLPLFPVFVSNSVSSVESAEEETEGGCKIGVGECPASPCRDESCLRRVPQQERPSEIPGFDAWPREYFSALDAGLECLVSKLPQCRDSAAAFDLINRHSPIYGRILSGQIEGIHRRHVFGSAKRKPRAFRLSCFPGAARSYCSLRGGLFPCERVEFGEFFEIGDATSGVDADKAYNCLVERIRLGCDCGNCVANEVCSLCPSWVTESKESPGKPDYLALQKTCKQLASESTFLTRLSTYASIMEANDKVLDWLFPQKTPGQGDWLSDVKVIMESREYVELPVEELAEQSL